MQLVGALSGDENPTLRPAGNAAHPDASACNRDFTTMCFCAMMGQASVDAHLSIGK
ncbi:MAG: hypothetical protein IJ121_11200 [Eubacterium sp.]|nr:hypothetical protein [Eubacterium sp.]